MKPFSSADEAAIDGQHWTLRHHRRGLTSSVARWWMGGSDHEEQLPRYGEMQAVAYLCISS